MRFSPPLHKRITSSSSNCKYVQARKEASEDFGSQHGHFENSYPPRRLALSNEAVLQLHHIQRQASHNTAEV